MKLHEAIDRVLQSSKRPMKTREIADVINQRNLYQRADRKPLPSSQVGARAKNYPDLFFKSDGMIHRSAWKSLSPIRQSDHSVSGSKKEPVSSEKTLKPFVESSRSNIKQGDLAFAKKNGFQLLGELSAMMQNGLPKHSWLDQPGVYLVTAAQTTPAFILPSDTKNVIRPWPVEKLASKWVNGTEVLYIGLAGSRSPRSLRQRLRELLRHAKGKISTNGPHKGGEILWQVVGWERFFLWAKPTDPPPEPRTEELRLMHEFEALHGRLPFGNRNR